MMKKKFTKPNQYYGFFLFSLLIAIQISLIGQTSHNIGVTSNVFTPNELTINIGDTVIWTNTQGNHNVNGTTTTFASNPESFGNDVGAGWVFSHVFTIHGAYDYRCDPHFSFGMTGKITVNDITASAFDTEEQNNGFSVYPNPATNRLFVVSDGSIESLSIYNVTGAMVLEFSNLKASEFEVTLDGISSGVYFLEVKTAEYGSQINRFVKR